MPQPRPTGRLGLVTLGAAALLACLAAGRTAVASPGAPGVTTGIGPDAARSARLAPGDHRLELRHDGVARSYIVHVPPAARGRRPLPLLLSFHGGGGNAAHQQRYTAMDPLADREGFVVVYPDGSGRGPLLTWNAGTCCAYAAQQQVDDVGFALAVVADVGRRLAVDTHRVYATGMSNGGMMAHRLAAEAPDRIAAIAPVAGGLVYQRFAPSQPVAVLHIHSLDDPRALYHGGLGPSLGGYRVLHPDVDEMMAKWAAADGCAATPRVVDERRAEDGDTATLLRWDGCAGGAEVELWRLTGAGHVWPGSPVSRPRLLGQETSVIDANEVIWEFVSRFRR
ncbi:MAG TPA: alpha/beta fold hydrolase [Thermoanaerobaculia bacterium]|jgi:polyhydroxybutyrate depolymerase|nr:alpha/beta fold hydrolase [Thermoanaerobaculia bacterium]